MLIIQSVGSRHMQLQGLGLNTTLFVIARCSCSPACSQGLPVADTHCLDPVVAADHVQHFGLAAGPPNLDGHVALKEACARGTPQRKYCSGHAQALSLSLVVHRHPRPSMCALRTRQRAQDHHETPKCSRFPEFLHFIQSYCVCTGRCLHAACAFALARCSKCA